MPRLDEFVFAPDQESERVYLLGLGLPGVSGEELEEQMEELAELARTAGAEVVGSDVQHLRAPNPLTCYGKGKVEELKALKSDLDFTTVVSNEDLVPRQQRNLEDALDMKVLDRTEVILDIFARHARTHEGRLQVEAAQLRHLLPRLTGGRKLSRLGGGIGTRGPGEQKLEVDRRRIRGRIQELKRDLEKVEKSRSLHRQARRRDGIPVVGVVGYTNAGKSTLMNVLTQAGVLEADQVFATLDPTTRAARLPGGMRVLFTDTVGFIQKLPTDLVEAFKGTLEEVTEASVILHVLDIRHPAMLEHFLATNEVLEELRAMDKPLLLALNKADLLDPETTEMIKRRGDWAPYEEVVVVSARTGEGMESLLEAVDRLTQEGLVRIELLLPYEHAGLESELRERGRVLLLDYEDDGISITAEVSVGLAGRYARYRRPPAKPGGAPARKKARVTGRAG
ncbi:MAG: GTPase [Chloroflexota bacterium]|jgi:GTP-binding protein HflX|nr:GTPase [Chloroflexota bacterium]